MKIGFTNGCFDHLHEGHKYLLEQARTHCDYLILAINSDPSVRFLKGPGRPIHPLADRIGEIQAQCGPWVDAIIPFDGAVLPLIETIRPDVIIRGEDQGYEGSELVRIVRVRRLPGHSTTEIADARRRVS
jgi:D-beta-D-heptose 7-phosphate kinase/D-beta-D-heptose 1-phosphate adenosyltransferase